MKQFFETTVKQWNLPKEDAKLIFSFDIEKFLNLYRIRKLLSGLFMDLKIENEWLREPQEYIGYKKPLSLILYGDEDDLLLVAQYVEYICNR